MSKKQHPKIRGVYEYPKGSETWSVRYADGAGKVHREKVGLR
jgi:hypothetical protein